MAWVVDSCVILDIALNDPQFGHVSAKAVAARLKDGLVACPTSVIEIVPTFGGDFAETKRFLQRCGISAYAPWLDSDSEAAAQGWQTYVSLKRKGQSPKRPMADILIGGFAMRHQGLLTRNEPHFRSYFPGLNLVSV
jgi:hypothetical protein